MAPFCNSEHISSERAIELVGSLPTLGRILVNLGGHRLNCKVYPLLTVAGTHGSDIVVPQ